jgi:ribosomal protein S18 acetylase RimI-like enzyme
MDTHRLNAVTIRHAESETEIVSCFPVMVLLRPHLTGVEEFLTRIKRQRQSGYFLLAAWDAATPVALAGYRLEENLIRGKFIYVDDLVTAAEARRHRIGAQLLDAVGAIGRAAGCRDLVLDTALDNVLGHRFYYRQGMLARALRFSRPIIPE